MSPKEQILKSAAEVKRKNIPFSLDEKAFGELIKRVAGDIYAEFVKVRKKESESGFDEYIISDTDSGILIEATSGSAAASAFNRYLREYCNYNIGINFISGRLPKVPPHIGKRIEERSRFHYRFFMNYCTYGYSYAFYDAEQWNDVLDRILLHGYNLILNPIAQEYVWYEFLKRLGYSDSDARKYLVPPTYMPWFLMGNMHSLEGGKYSDRWFNGRKKIAGDFNLRMQKFGCSTLIPGFGGMIPNDIDKYMAGSSPFDSGLWCNMPRPAYIGENDVNFEKTAKLFYECQRLIDGAENVHYYSADPFHELIKLPEGTNLAKLGAAIQGAMQSFDKDAVWVLQGWQKNPRREMLTELDKSHILVQNLLSDISFNAGDDFSDSPWLYCTVNNYGGQHIPRGSVYNSLVMPFKAVDGDKYTSVGVGLMPESTETDEIFFDILSSISVRSAAIGKEEYLRGFVTRRYGECRDDIYRAWSLLANNVYGSGTISESGVEVETKGQGSAFCARPGLDTDRVSTWNKACVVRNQPILKEIVEILFSNIDRYKHEEAFVYDVVDFTRQMFAEDSWKCVYAVQKAYKERNIEELKRCANDFLHRFDLMNNLLANSRGCLLGKWLGYASNYRDASAEDRKWFEKNARMLITLWAPREGYELHDYAAREYSPLMIDFYRKRWEKFLNILIDCASNGREFADYDHYTDEEEFVFDRTQFPAQPAGNLKKAVSDILAVKNIGTTNALTY